MAARTKGQLFLEKLQEREYKRLGRLGDYEKDNALRDPKFVSEMVDKMLQKRAAFMSPEEMAELRAQTLKGINEAANIERPTKYEEPGKYNLMTTLARQI